MFTYANPLLMGTMNDRDFREFVETQCRIAKRLCKETHEHLIAELDNLSEKVQSCIRDVKNHQKYAMDRYREMGYTRDQAKRHISQERCVWDDDLDHAMVVYTEYLNSNAYIRAYEKQHGKTPHLQQMDETAYRRLVHKHSGAQGHRDALFFAHTLPEIRYLDEFAGQLLDLIARRKSAGNPIPHEMVAALDKLAAFYHKQVEDVEQWEVLNIGLLHRVKDFHQVSGM